MAPGLPDNVPVTLLDLAADLMGLAQRGEVAEACRLAERTAPETTGEDPADQAAFWYAVSVARHIQGDFAPTGEIVRARANDNVHYRIERPAARKAADGKIESGPSPAGGFTPVSGAKRVGSRTVFSLHGSGARYYVIWITALPSGGVAHVDEVTAKS